MRDSTCLGEFEVQDGTLIVSDPCYNLGTWCQGTIGSVKNGKWIGYIHHSDEEWGYRVARLFAVHSDYCIGNLRNKIEGYVEDWDWNDPRYLWEHEGFDIGVDSGQAGIFDQSTYRNDELIIDTPTEYFGPENEPGNRWYSAVCNITLDRNNQAGVIANRGVVSSSGFGDGGYDCYTITKEDKVIAVGIDFLVIDNEEDEDPDHVEE